MTLRARGWILNFMGHRSIVRSIGFWFAIIAISGLAWWVYLQHRTLARLSDENRRLAGIEQEMDRLRAALKETQSLSNQEIELQQLRADSRDLLRLRNEVHQLREQQKEAETLRAANARLLQAIQGVNLASNQQALVADVRSQGAVLGIVIRPANDPQTGSTTARYNGAVVAQLDPSSPVVSSGLMIGDIIIRADGRPIENAGQLQAEMLTRKPGDVVTLDVMRNDSLLRIPVQTRAWPK
jgi:C-terminal processing protease CtpA/Prc